MKNFGVTLEESDALFDAFNNKQYSIDLNKTLADIEKSHLLLAMHQSQNNQTRAAAALGLKRETLIHKLKKYEITP